MELHAFYKTLIALRRSHEALRRGTLSYAQTSDPMQTLAYVRATANDRVIVVFNNAAGAADLNVKGVPDGSYVEAISGTPYRISDKTLTVKMDGKSAIILIPAR
jgi:glycosidase